MSGDWDFLFAWRRGNYTENHGPAAHCGIAILEGPQSLSFGSRRVQTHLAGRRGASARAVERTPVALKRVDSSQPVS